MIYTRGLPFKLGGQLAGRRLSSLPRTPIAGPLSIDSQATVAVLREAVRRVSRNAGLGSRSRRRGGNSRDWSDGLVCKPWRLSYILQLPEPSEGHYRVPDGRERAKIKWAVKKASQLGVTVRPAKTEADLRHWYEAYLETMRRNMIPPRPFRFFAALWKSLGPAGIMQVLIAEHGEASGKKLIAGAVFLMFGRTVSYAFSGMHRQYSSLRANDAIQWHAINEACHKGFQAFDFGEVPDGHTELAKFKSKWGAEPTRLYRYITPAPAAPRNGKAELPFQHRVASAGHLAALAFEIDGMDGRSDLSPSLVVALLIRLDPGCQRCDSV